jgi:hypothetical protein
VPSRRRTTKALAQRIDIDYFKRRHPFRSWRFVLAVAAQLVVLLWAAGAAITNHMKIYSAGPVSPSHAVFGSRCELCHATRAGFFSQQAKDEKCLACHDGPLHHTNQPFTPACSSCHAEHHGEMKLAAIADGGCVRCHGALQSKEGVPQFERAISRFDGAHPEFRALRADFRDPGTIKLNHKVHLQVGLKGPNGAVQMQCTDCHRVAAEVAAWPYGIAQSTSMVAGTQPQSNIGPRRRQTAGKAYMSQIRYAQQCAACHVLLFDARFAGPVPHDKPEVIHSFLVDRYAKLIASHPGEISSASRSAQRIPRQIEEPQPRTPAAWVQLRVADAERLLWQKTCKECHSLSEREGQLPEVAKSAIPARWFAHAEFDHDAHRLLACASCHERATSSQNTSDVLLPGIKTCRQCHRSQDPVKSGSADGRCSECHAYHDWSREVPARSPYTLRQVTR